ncbi:unnamed protein product [Diabrotica balteata]|uniref:Acyltransferase C-terminal domain-containing protein n=1 Tax=Diabrotica balteata TaxID=107213 RepID=A0A9N9SWX7_DIABA|nr:unnamed protein product [Diabrotica balteata]
MSQIHNHLFNINTNQCKTLSFVFANQYCWEKTANVVRQALMRPQILRPLGIENDVIEGVHELVYLEMLVNTDNKTTAKINARIFHGPTSCYFELILHGKTSNDIEIYTRCKVENIKEWVRNRRLEWNDHISRTTTNRVVKTTRDSSAIGRGSEGTPRKRWNDNLLRHIENRQRVIYPKSVLPTSEDGLKQFLEKRWRDKETIIKEFNATGKFLHGPILRCNKRWELKCEGLGVPIRNDHLYTLSFGDDQVIITQDEEDLSYMVRKLEEYNINDLGININKIEYLNTTQEPTRNLEVDDGHEIKGTDKFKYLGSLYQIKVLQKKKLKIEHITKINKERIYNTMKSRRNKINATEMDYWRRSCRLSRMDKITNDEIKRRMEIKKDTLNYIEEKRLKWYGHVRRINPNRWIAKITVEPHRKTQKRQTKKIFQR